MDQFDALRPEEIVSAKKNGWLHTHPYAATLFGAAILILVGFVIVERHTAVAPNSSSTSAWGGGLLDTLGTQDYSTSQQAPQNPADLMRQVQGGAPYTYTPPNLTTPSGNPAPLINTNQNFDFDAFIAELTGQRAQTQTKTNATVDTSSAYAFIPQGLISTTTPSKKMTQAQEDLYNYGNDIGSTIQTFEDTHLSMSQILKDQMEDRENPEKIVAVVHIGTDYVSLGKNLEHADPIPAQVAAAHMAVAKSYQDLGAKLSLVAQARTNEALLSAITTYNASADAFSKNFVALATIFSASGVTFAPTEGGSVFMFTNTAGL